MKIAYFGTPKISSNLLEKLLNKGFKIPLVITQKNKPAGKHMQDTPSPIKMCARNNKIEIFDKDIPKHDGVLKKALQENEIDLCVVFAYGKIISKELLYAIKYGFINVHPSLLPLYRGPSPIHFPILLGDSLSGSTLIKMNEKLDEGDILKQDHISLGSYDRSTLESHLIDIAVLQIDSHVHNLQNGLSHQTPQDHSKATYTRKITRQDGYIAPGIIRSALSGEVLQTDKLPDVFKWYMIKNPDVTILNNINASSIVLQMFRAFNNWPGIWTTILVQNNEKRLKILEVETDDTKKLVIKQVQLEGKKQVDYETFLKAYRI